MNHTMSFPKNKSFYAFVALALTLAAAIIVLLTLNAKQPGIPVTSAPVSVEKAAPNRSIDLGAGYRLEMNAQGSQVTAPEFVAKPAPKKIDLGAGYWLEMAPGQASISAPARPAASNYQKIDLGAGYVLELNAGTGVITAPSAAAEAPASAAITRIIDLGAGYRLELSAAGGQIIAPAAPAKAQGAQPGKTYLGGGYWLVTGPDGSQIVKEGAQ